MDLPAVRTHKIMIERLVVLNKLRGVLQLAPSFNASYAFRGLWKRVVALDYAKPKSQFLAKDVAVKGKTYVGDKITVKGTVTKVDVSDPSSAKIYLEDGIECNLGKFKAMATSCKGWRYGLCGWFSRALPGGRYLASACHAQRSDCSVCSSITLQWGY